jgi:hypothetical protein
MSPIFGPCETPTGKRWILTEFICNPPPPTHPTPKLQFSFGAMLMKMLPDFKRRISEDLKKNTGTRLLACNICHNRTGMSLRVRLLWPRMRGRSSVWSSGQSSWLHNGDVICFLWGTNWIYVCYVEESRPPLWSSGRSSWLQNGDVSCFLWRTNWIYICYVEESRPPLSSSGQSSWLHNGDVLCFLWGTNW